MANKISQKAIDLIKKFEGCRLKAYQDSVGVWTIGYGITNACRYITGLEVKKGVKITQKEADKYLQQVLDARYVPYVTKYNKIYHWNQNQLDALVSFCYNIGSIDGLVKNGKRTIAEISSAIPCYNKAGSKTLLGLTRRRKAEKKLFDTKWVEPKPTVTKPIEKPTPVKNPDNDFVIEMNSYKYKGIEYNKVFNATFYLNHSTSVSEKSNSAKELFKHFINVGMKEGRQGCSTFNPKEYRKKYPTLNKAYGDDWTKYYIHYMAFCNKGMSN